MSPHLAAGKASPLVEAARSSRKPDLRASASAEHGRTERRDGRAPAAAMKRTPLGHLLEVASNMQIASVRWTWKLALDS
jgi:hypothetical protein